ncbi:hypothetical protein [Labrenzia sp. CE80]|uniref:hypothetical protein n=1 Tax=Labrenzia sp. CE80 TaxID=1788986 RepID=UPI00129A4BC1|nr:hypothetical protein [Labrenzia sp. CE80]
MAALSFSDLADFLFVPGLIAPGRLLLPGLRIFTRTLKRLHKIPHSETVSGSRTDSQILAVTSCDNFQFFNRLMPSRKEIQDIVAFMAIVSWQRVLSQCSRMLASVEAIFSQLKTLVWQGTPLK